VTIYYEDLDVGWSETYGSHTMDREAMISFAEQFDPQPMHVDPEAATESIHGDVIASGVHTIGIATRLLVDGFLRKSANLAGLGIDDLRFHEAVYPGDTLAVRHEIVDKRRSESHPDAGIVTREVQVFLSESGTDWPERGTDRTGNEETVVASWTVAILLAIRW